MFKNIARLECQIGDRIYHLMCDHDSPISELKEALCQFTGYAVAVEKAHQDAQKAEHEAQEPVEEVKPVEE